MFGFNLDFWTVWGFSAQGLFFLSFVAQWYMSEKKKQSYLPVQFWLLRLFGSLMLLVYVFIRRDVVFMVSVVLQIVIYVRNLQLIKDKS
jgi:lipid-A-disaccharide synthase-like uncharacterized protein